MSLEGPSTVAWGSDPCVIDSVSLARAQRPMLWLEEDFGSCVWVDPIPKSAHVTQCSCSAFSKTNASNSALDTLVDLLVQGGNRQEILRFRLGSEPQSRLDELLEKNRIGTITPEEASS